MSRRRWLLTIAFTTLLAGFGRAAQRAGEPLILFAGMGDSIAEGVQTADANEWTQPFSFLNLIAWRMGAPFPLPLIRTGPFAVVGDNAQRLRIRRCSRSIWQSTETRQSNGGQRDAAARVRGLLDLEQ
jgi:hypothetical protein